MRVLVTGSRDWADEGVVRHELAELAIKNGWKTFTVMHGGCPTGADAMAATWCQDVGVTEEVYLADWKTHGRAAGPRRNQQMVDIGADLCLAFIGPCTSPRCNLPGAHDSHGATGCAALAEQAGITTRRYRSEDL